MINDSISVLEDGDEQLSIPKPNYAAEKPEDAFNLDDSSWIDSNERPSIFLVHSHCGQ